MQEPVRVVGMRGDAAAARPQRADDRQRPEEVLGQAVDRAAELGLDAVHDRRRVGRDRARVVGDEQRAALGRDLLEALPLDAEPVLVDRVVDAAGQRAEVLAAAPLVDVGAARVLVDGAVLAGRAGRGRGRRRRVGLGEVEVGVRRRRDLDGTGRFRRVGAVGHRASQPEFPRAASCCCLTWGVESVWDGADVRNVNRRGSATSPAASARRRGRPVSSCPRSGTPPRTAGAMPHDPPPPGGPVVAVRIQSRPFADVVADMVDGVLAANRLDGAGGRRACGPRCCTRSA